MLPQPQQYKVKFIKKEQVSKDAYTFYFEKGSLLYLPGQYCKISLDIQKPDERGNTRFFTLSSSPTEEYITITTRIIRSSFKKALFALHEGTEIKLFAPLGRFILDEQVKIPRVFLAGGIGITPFRSMIMYAYTRKLHLPITLISSFKNEGDIIFQKDLETIKKDYTELSIVNTLTEPENAASWQGHTGRVDTNFINETITDIKNSLYFISGPEAMVDGLARVIFSFDVPEENIKKENFSGY